MMFHIAEAKLSYNPKFKRSSLPKITESGHAYKILLQYWNKEQIDLIEEFHVMLLNRSNKLLGIFHASKGGMSGTVVDPKLIFVAALKGCASSIILAHNHPSGNLKPSQSDIALTNKMVSAGLLLDIPVIEHIIMTSEGYMSFADSGMM